MPPSSPLSDESTAPSDLQTEPQQCRRLARSLKGPIRFLGFWTAIVLPFVHVPLLVSGLENPTVVATFLLLLAANLLALYVGHGYNRE